MITLSMKDAITKVIAEEMRRDSKILVLGENVHFGSPSGAKLVAPLFKEFGEDRILETPVSENAIVGGSFGLALGGMTAIAEIFSADFLFTAGNELLNDIPKWRIQHGLDQPLPIVIRGPSGVHPNGGGGPEHSQCPEAYFVHCPGISVVVPGTPADAYGLMRSAIRSGNPVIFLEHRRLYSKTGPVPDDHNFSVKIGEASIVRPGSQGTVVAWGWMREVALAAAEQLEHQNVDVELIDLRTIVPMDVQAVIDSVEKTGRLVVVEEASGRGGVGAELIAAVHEALDGRAFQARRVAMPHAPLPYDHELERKMLPDANRIKDAVLALMGRDDSSGRVQGLDFMGTHT